MHKSMRVEQQQIRRDHPLWSLIDDFCFRSKELYNKANFIIRKSFFDSSIKGRIKYHQLDKMMQKTSEYKNLMSQASQCTLQVLDRSWKSFEQASKDYEKYPSKYNSKPKPPAYKKVNGRFPWFLKNNQIYFENGWLWFKLKVFHGYRFHTHLTDNDRIVSIRFVPKGCIYVLEIVYEIDVPDIPDEEPCNVASIDLGVNNLVTLTNNIGLRPIIINGRKIKSINYFYYTRREKEISRLQLENNHTEKYWSKYLDSITLKRNNRMKNIIHHATKYIVDWCVMYGIDILICGYNKRWKNKSKMSKQSNFAYQYIPHKQLVEQLQYKCEANGIRFVTTEESYTSGTSFLDDEQPIKENYNKSRRIVRGLFKSNDGTLINSDVNGSFQIMRKIFSNVKSEEIQGNLTPIVVNATV
ncbi:MAG: RNA-guided endonuclease InsQ/TnpB family protein [Methanobrevibacter sp.]